MPAYHARVTCRECGWMDDDHLTALTEAAKHAEETGHKMSAEVGVIVDADGLSDLLCAAENVGALKLAKHLGGALDPLGMHSGKRKTKEGENGNAD